MAKKLKPCCEERDKYWEALIKGLLKAMRLGFELKRKEDESTD